VTAQDEQAGQTVECPSCLTAVAVPSIPPVAMPPMVTPPPLPPSVGNPYVAPAKDPISLWGHFLRCLKNYATFSGRARRREFWGFFLFWFLATVVLGLVNLALNRAVPTTASLVLSNLFLLAFLLPSFAVICRRFHDIGKSGRAAIPLFIAIPAYMITGAISGLIIQSIVRDVGASSAFALTPQDLMRYKDLFAVANGFSTLSGLLGLASLVYILVFLTRDSVPGDNPYGPNPKGTSPYPYGTEVRGI